MLKEEISPREVATAEGLTQITDAATVAAWVDAVMLEMARAVEDYRNGKEAAMKALQGRVMAMSRGRADPLLCEEILLKKLNKKENDE
jgi:aspartyl-tRNA(Asn)/glutamyl-tRNA(Gln) amidotransferase subunit B